MDVTTLTNVAAAWGLVLLLIGGWVSWRVRRESTVTTLDQVRAERQARRESLRRAAATEYGRRTDRHGHA